MLWPQKENCSVVQIENYLNLHKFVNSSKWIFNFHTGPCSCAGPGQFHLNINIVFIPELSVTPFARKDQLSLLQFQVKLLLKFVSCFISKNLFYIYPLGSQQYPPTSDHSPQLRNLIATLYST